MDTLLPYILTLIAGIVLNWFIERLKKRKTDVDIEKMEVDIEKSKVDIQKIIADQLLEANEFLNEQQNRIIKKFREEKQELLNKIDSLLNVTKKLKEDCESLKYRNTATELIIKHFKKHIDFSLLKREVVYLYDDDPFISEEFHKRFDKLSILDFESFRENDKYMAALNQKKPGTIIIDMKLDGGRTAEDVIKDTIKVIGHQPETFIISISDFYKERFNDTKEKFYLKDDFYVDEISIEVLEHLIDKD